MILLIDNYDSFSYNLYQQMSRLGEEVCMKRNDALTIEDIRQLQPRAIVLSPGPGTPNEAGICLAIVQELQDEYAILGICLGHQTIAQAFGGKIVQAKQIMHGQQSTLMHTGHRLLKRCSPDTVVMRYHSLAVDQESFPKADLAIIATAQDGEIMALAHHSKPIYGLQFHPESFGTEEGDLMIAQFLTLVK